MEHAFKNQQSETTPTEAFAACFYTPAHSLWVQGGWKCPHCLALSGEAEVECGCGFSRENLHDFRNNRAFPVAKLVLILPL